MNEELALTQTYLCLVCGYEYNEGHGDLAAGIRAETPWTLVPLSFRCPDCGAGKEDFEAVPV